MGIFDDKSDVDEAYEEGQHAGAHKGAVDQVINDLGRSIDPTWTQEMKDAYEAGEKNGRENPPEDD